MAILGRTLLLITRFLQFASAVIVLGITGWLLHVLGHSSHIVYILVIAAISALLYLPGLLSPFLPKIGWFTFLVDYILSYLWLAAFILTVIDYTDGADCAANSPPGGQCSKKYAILAFSLIALFFTWLSALLEIWNLWRHEKEYGVTTATSRV
ncbi:hypothetical protein VTO42DRAFT_379 [Malbranchea cinnamomea]